MSKREGKKVILKFTRDLIGDVTGNELAFGIKGKQRCHIDGVLVNGDYQVEKVERYPINKIWQVDFNVGVLIDTVFDDGLLLGVEE